MDTCELMELYPRAQGQPCVGPGRACRWVQEAQVCKQLSFPGAGVESSVWH